MYVFVCVRVVMVQAEVGWMRGAEMRFYDAIQDVSFKILKQSNKLSINFTHFPLYKHNAGLVITIIFMLDVGYLVAMRSVFR